MAEDASRNLTPEESIAGSLRELGIPESDYDSFIERTLLALPGWAGMMWQMETNAAWTIRPAPAGSLHQFLAVRLLIDRASLAEVAQSAVGKLASSADYVRELKRMLPNR